MDARGSMGNATGSVGTSAHLQMIKEVGLPKTAHAGTQSSSMEMENGVAAQIALVAVSAGSSYNRLQGGGAATGGGATGGAATRMGITPSIVLSGLQPSASLVSPST